MTRVGPDGALWIADMYRQTIEHPEWIPDEWEKRLDLRSGHDKGRIYRVYPVGVKPRGIPRFDQLTAAQLVELLESPGGTVRDMAQQRLIELNDTSVADAVENVARSSSRATARLHALCTLAGLGQLTAERADLLLACLSDEHPAVRCHAIRLAEPLLKDTSKLLSACLRLADDADPQVRQQLAYTLGECHDEQSATTLAKLLIDNAPERLIVAAAISSLHKDNIAAVFGAISKENTTQPPLPQNVLQAVIATSVGLDPKRGWAPVASLLSSHNVGYATWQLQAAGNLFAALETHGTDVATVLNTPESKPIADLVRSAQKLAVDEALPLESRIAAIRLLGVAPSANDNAAELEKLISPDQPLAIQGAAIAVAAKRGRKNVTDRLIADWTRYSPQIRSQILDALLAQTASAARLLDWIEQGDVQPSDLSTAQRDRLLGHRQRGLRDRAEKLLAQSIDRNRQNVLEKFSHLAISAGRIPGDAGRGLAVFEKRCATCHRWGDRGQEVGPDLAALTDRLPGTMLVAIFDPNRAVESKYISYTATTGQGLSHTGILAQESDTSITLIKADGKRESLLRRELDELSSNGKSLMPEGLESELTDQDVADLLTFLSGSPNLP
jgi:putative heme-binding domain-containing protein